MGSQRRPGHGHPREHRVPPADGAVLLVAGRTPRPLVDRPAAVAGMPAVRSGRRDALPVPNHRPAWAGPVRGLARLHVHPVPAPVHREDLGHPDAVVGSAVDDCLRHPGPAPRRMALSGAVRLGGGAGQRDQRQLHPLCGDRPGPVVALRGRSSCGRPPVDRPGGWPARSDCCRLWSRCGGPSGYRSRRPMASTSSSTPRR